MENARSAVSSFLSKGGKQTTDVDENVQPAVTEEVIQPHRHEETREAIDKEVHQDHYHTTVQPVAAKEVMPEQHMHQTAPQVEREYYHGNEEEERQRQAADLGQFRDTRAMEQTTTSAGAVDAVAGEHHHHHVHEVVQPVIHKEVVQPEFVHTTVPIHEKHIAPSEHHGMSQLPTKTLDEMRSMGTPLEGGVKHHEEYEGHPKPYAAKFQVERHPVDEHPNQHEGMHVHQESGLSKGVPYTSGSTGMYDTTGSSYDPSTTAYPAGGALGEPGYGNTGYGSTGYGSTGYGMPVTEGTGGTTGYEQGYRERMEMGDVGRGERQESRLEPERYEREQPRESLSQGRRESSSHSRRESSSHSRRESKPRDISGDDNVQHASLEGNDPSMADRSGGKLTGSGVDGSHSAVFGLTPDGHKYNDTKHGQSGGEMPKSQRGEMPSAPGGEENPSENTSAKRGGSGGVADQLHDPRVAEKGHEGQGEYEEASDEKPGAGGKTSNVV